jgi:hypothetical protein
VAVWFGSDGRVWNSEWQGLNQEIGVAQRILFDGGSVASIPTNMFAILYDCRKLFQEQVSAD